MNNMKQWQQDISNVVDKNSLDIKNFKDNAEVGKLTARIDNIEAKDREQDVQLSNHGEQLENLFNKINTDVADTKTEINNTIEQLRLNTNNSITALQTSIDRHTEELDNCVRITGGNITGNLSVQNKNVATEEFVNNIKINIIKKNDGNDYYDDSDITSLIYAGSEEGTIRNEIANGDFSRVHPGQTIIGRVTGTTYVVVGCNIYKHRGDTELTQNHIGLMPIQLIGNAGNLLWSGRTEAGSDVNNTEQGYAPWASDNNTEGKSQTSCYKDSYIAKTVLPKVDNLWLKPDFENQGISVLTFRNLEAISFDVNATCMSNPNWRGCATNWGWASRRLVLPSELEIYGHYHWSGSPWESGSQHTQLPLYRHKEIHKVYPSVDIWLKDSASASGACFVSNAGLATFTFGYHVFRVCPLFLIA